MHREPRRGPHRRVERPALPLDEPARRAARAARRRRPARRAARRREQPRGHRARRRRAPRRAGRRARHVPVAAPPRVAQRVGADRAREDLGPLGDGGAQRVGGRVRPGAAQLEIVRRPRARVGRRALVDVERERQRVEPERVQVRVLAEPYGARGIRARDENPRARRARATAPLTEEHHLRHAARARREDVVERERHDRARGRVVRRARRLVAARAAPRGGRVREDVAEARAQLGRERGEARRHERVERALAEVDRPLRPRDLARRGERHDALAAAAVDARGAAVARVAAAQRADAVLHHVGRRHRAARDRHLGVARRRRVRRAVEPRARGGLGRRDELDRRRARDVVGRRVPLGHRREHAARQRGLRRARGRAHLRRAQLGEDPVARRRGRRRGRRRRARAAPRLDERGERPVGRGVADEPSESGREQQRARGAERAPGGCGGVDEHLPGCGGVDEQRARVLDLFVSTARDHEARHLRIHRGEEEQSWSRQDPRKDLKLPTVSFLARRRGRPQ